MAPAPFGSYKAPLTLGLESLMRVQKEVSGGVPGAIPAPGLYPSKDAVRTYSLALITEIAEWLQDLDTRPWKNDLTEAAPVVDNDTLAEEFADMLAFLGILIYYMNQWGIPPERLASAYVAKSNINIERITANLRKG